MSGGKKLVVVLSVLITGASAALFFRKDASQISAWQEAQNDPAFHERVERRVTSGTDWTKSPPRTTSRAQQPKQALRVLAAPTAAITESTGAADHQPIVQKNFNPVGALLEPIEGPLPPENETGYPATADVPLSPAVEQPLMHRIVDGDTLSKLAVTYLGRGDRYLEIFELNRDLLTSPDLLPIGSVLKIPPRQTSATGSQGSASPPAEMPAEPPLELVPVPTSDRPI